MIASDCHRARPIRSVTFAALLALCPALAGCAGMSDTMSTAFADPAKYDLYDCKQLEIERKSLAGRSAELQGLMAKAETGTGGVVVSELAYRNDYIAIRGQVAVRRRGLAQEQMRGDAASATAGQARRGQECGSKSAQARTGRQASPAGRPCLDPAEGWFDRLIGKALSSDSPVVDPALPRQQRCGPSA